MGEILDLRAYMEETADIRMTDGRLLRLKKPSQRMVIHMMAMKDLDDNATGEETLDSLNGVVLEILNNNADGLTFDAHNVETLTLDMKLMLVSAYADFATKLQQNPTAASPLSQTEEEQREEPKVKRSLRERFTRWRNTRA